jgi:hypothetical protein
VLPLIFGAAFVSSGPSYDDISVPSDGSAVVPESTSGDESDKPASALPDVV